MSHKKNLIVLVGIGILTFFFFQNFISPSHQLSASGYRIVGAANDSGDSVLVSAFDVTAYGILPSQSAPVGTGTPDATTAFQMAIDDCYLKGGGTVYAPAGYYYFTGNLIIPEGVTLQGDWHAPSMDGEKVDASKLTVLSVNAIPSGTPFIQFVGGSAVANMSFWYPKQTLTTSYPATVQTALSSTTTIDNTFGGQFPDRVPAKILLHPTRHSLALRNLTFYNSSQGINFVLTDKGIQSPRAENIYGTPLSIGIEVGNSGSIGFFRNLNFDPVFWAHSGLPGSPAQAAIAALTRASGTAISGEIPIAFANFNDYGVGLSIDINSLPASHGEFFGVNILRAYQPIHILSGTDILHISKSNLESVASGPKAAAIYLENASHMTVLVNETKLSATNGPTIYSGGSGTVNVMKSVFSRWGKTSVDAEAGDLQIEGSEFVDPLHAPRSHVQLGAGFIGHSILMSNTVDQDQPFVLNNLSQTKYLSDPSLNSNPYLGFAKIGFEANDILARVPAPPRPKNPSALFVVTDYGAKGDGVNDDTSAINHALQDAGVAGGVVYLPGGTGQVDSKGVVTYSSGAYRVTDTLVVPNGVELLGAAGNTLFYTDSVRTYIFAQPNPKSTKPLITLGGSAGLRGIAIWYLDQQINLGSGILYKFPYTVQSQGDGNWIVNIVFGNSYDGADFATFSSNNHYIKEVTGFAVDNMLNVSQSSNGYIENFHTASYYPDVDQTGLMPIANPSGHNPIPGYWLVTGVGDINAMGDAITGYDNMASGTAIILGSAKQELMINMFTHSPHTGIKTINDHGTPSFDLINFGGEINTAFDFEALDSDAGATIVNGTWHTLGTDYYPRCNGGCECGSFADKQVPIPESDPQAYYNYTYKQACIIRNGQPYVVVGNQVSNTTPINFFAIRNFAFTPVGIQASGGKLTIQQYFNEQNANPKYAKAGISLNEWALIDTNSSFTSIGAIFQHRFDSNNATYGLINSTSNSAGLAGAILPGNCEMTGTVDLSFQPFCTGDNLKH